MKESSINISKENYSNGFEEQFSRKEEVEILGGKIELVDIRPEILKTEVPVLFAPGWGGTPETYKDSLRTLYEKNRRVLSLAHARHGEVAKLLPEETQKEYPAEELRKAMALLAVLEEKNIDKVDGVAHSEGGINIAIAASLAPEKFRNIIFVNVGGLIGKDKFPKLAGRFFSSVIREAMKVFWSGGETDKMRYRRAMKESSKYIFQNPARAVSEAVAISESQTQNMLRDLHDNGIGIAVICGTDDPVFPMDKMQKIVNKNLLDSFISVKGGHSEILLHPEKYAAAADELLDNLNKKRHYVK